MMHNDKGEVNDRFLRQTLSPLILNFRAIREVMEEQAGVPFASQHSSQVQSSADVMAIAQKVLNLGACRLDPGRRGPRRQDLYSDGRDALAGQQPLQKYIEHMHRGIAMFTSVPDQDTEVVTGSGEGDIDSAEVDVDPAEVDVDPAKVDEDWEVDLEDFLLDEGDDWLTVD